MITLLAALAWSLVILLSFIGLGQILARLLVPELRVDPFLAAGWGLAGMIAIGGLLNIAGIAKAPVLVGLVLAVIGVNLLWRLYQKPITSEIARQERSKGTSHASAPPGRWDVIWLFALGLAVTIKFVSVLGYTGNYGDDKPAYLAQATRLIQTGSIGVDPFNDRQLLSLNGQSFLLGLFLSIAAIKYVFLLDPGIYWIIVTGFAWVMVRRDLGGSIGVACALAGMILMIDEPRFVNTGGHLTGAVLGLTLMQTAYLGTKSSERLEGKWLVLLAMTLAGLSRGKDHVPFFRRTLRCDLVLAANSRGFTGQAWARVVRGRCGHYCFSSCVDAPAISLERNASLSIPRQWKSFLNSRRGYFQRSNLGQTEGDDLLHIRWGGGAGDFVSVDSGHEPDQGRDETMASHAGIALGRRDIRARRSVPVGAGSPLAVPGYTQAILYCALIPAGLWGFFSTNAAGRGLAVCLALFVGNQWENCAYGHLQRARNAGGSGRRCLEDHGAGYQASP